MTPGALLKFNRESFPDATHAPERPYQVSKGKHPRGATEVALTTHSILKMIAGLRAEKRRIEEAIFVLERLAAGRKRKS